MRKRLPMTRRGWTHKGVIHSEKFGRTKFFVTANVGETGKVQELFLTLDQSGSCLDGWADAWSTAVSMLLQNGEELEAVIRKFRGQKFEPCGWTEDKGIRRADSIPDYVVRWLERVTMGEEGVRADGRTGPAAGWGARERAPSGGDSRRPVEAMREARRLNASGQPRLAQGEKP